MGRRLGRRERVGSCGEARSCGEEVGGEEKG